jgi:hypothetical protein
MNILTDKKIVRPSATGWSAFIGTLGIVCIVGIGVTYFTGGNGPPGIEEVMPWLYVGAVLFSVLAVIIYIRGQVQFQFIKEDDRSLTIKINDPKEVKEIKGPYEFTYNYQKVRAPKGPGWMKVLHLSFFENGKCVLALKEELGTIYSVPAGWPESQFKIGDPIPENEYKYVHYNSNKIVVELVRYLNANKL